LNSFELYTRAGKNAPSRENAFAQLEQALPADCSKSEQSRDFAVSKMEPCATRSKPGAIFEPMKKIEAAVLRRRNRALGA
jgi:hypothetical protein